MTCPTSPGQVCFTCALAGVTRCPFKSYGALPLARMERPKVVWSGRPKYVYVPPWDQWGRV